MIADLEAEGKEIEFEEFLDAITSKLGDKETRNGNQQKNKILGINKIFDLFDDNKTEVIDLTNLKRVAKELGETMTVEECNLF